MSKAWQRQPRGWQVVRLQVLARDGYRCQLRWDGCKVVADAVDHIVPRGRGGTDELDNLRAACTWCNSRRGQGRGPDPAPDRRSLW